MTHNDSYIICANSSAHRLQIDERKFCSSGEWKNIELYRDQVKTTKFQRKGPSCQIQNVNGRAVIDYWGKNPNGKCFDKHQFGVTDSLYCVSMK